MVGRAAVSVNLENEFFAFEVDPNEAIWSLHGKSGPEVAIEGVKMGLHYRRAGVKYRRLDSWPGCETCAVESAVTPIGPARQVMVKIRPDQNGLACRLTFALLEPQPLFLWKLEVENTGTQPVSLERLEMLRLGRTGGPATAAIRLNPAGGKPPEWAFYSNGWQSLNYSGVYGPEDHFRRTRLGPLSSPLRVNAGTPQPRGRGHFASDMFAVLGDRTSRTGLLAGFLSQQAHFGSLEAWIDSPAPALYMWANGDDTRLEPGIRVSTDWACLCFLNLDSEDPLGTYLQAVARQHGLAGEDPPPPSGSVLLRTVPTGWSSWYTYYEKVTAEDVRRNLSAAASLIPGLPLDWIQIDDGFERRPGDWFSFKQTFPQGVAPLSRDIQACGFKPGLWLAPFIVHPRSRLAQDHPDWLLRGRFNRLVNAGFLFDNTFMTALDLTNLAALDYACQVVHTAVHDWGFQYLKLDFLHAAALPGKHKDPTLTRAQVLRRGLQALRQAACKDTFLLGCGCPLGPAIGLVDAMRISSDVSDAWAPQIKSVKFFFQDEPDLPSARNAIHNTLARASLHRRWWLNDPDALLLRPDSHLTLAETQALATVIALSGGSLFLSDDLTNLPEERLSIARSLLPPIGLRPRVMDWFDAQTPGRLRLDLENTSGKWRLLALFNWADQPQDLTLRLAAFDLPPQDHYFAREFWSGKVYRIEKGSLAFEQVPAHGSVLLAVRHATDAIPQYLGSNLHISQGLELASWETTPEGLSFELERPGPSEGEVLLALPRPPQAAWLNGEPLAWQEIFPQVCAFPVKFQRYAKAQI
jgi:alpha-galactosidase